MAILISGGKSKFSLPSAWAPPPRNPRALQALAYLKVDDMRIKYVGPGETDLQAATVLTNHPCPADLPLFFFEVEIVSKGVEGFIGIGFSAEDVSLSRLPGWEPHSYGYHGDDGHVFLGSGRGTPYGPTFTTGDRIGCLLNRADRSISYWKNREPLGEATRGVPEDRLFPCIGMRSKDEEVLVTLPSPATLASNSFLSADLEGITLSYKDAVFREIDAARAPFQLQGGAGGGGGGPHHLLPILPQLVLDYLLHHRCPETAAILTKSLLQGDLKGSGGALGMQAEAKHRETVRGRQKVYDLISSRRTKEAIAEMETRWSSDILKMDTHLNFRLKVAVFCEILLGAPSRTAATEENDGPEGLCNMDVTEDNDAVTTDHEAALTYGRTVLAAHSPKSTEDDQLLQDALLLLAYQDPRSAPSGALLGPSEAQSLAEAVNGAILAYLGLPDVSGMERILQQTAKCIETLRQQNHPLALAVDMKLVLKL